jgi:uncharacterized membrane protein YqjE
MNISDTNDGDERYHITNLYTSIEGTVLCSTLGSFSGVASIAIIVIIFRSHDGLSSVYHRFIFGMSIGNLLAAVSMSLNTLLMPSDMPYTEFEGLHIGTQTTCNIQGFIFEFGNSIEITYFVSLLMYYGFYISLRMQNGTFRKFIEPALHLISITIGLAYSISSVVWDLLNPFVDMNWCSRSVLPFWCANEPESCIRGSARRAKVGTLAIAVTTSLLFAIAITCMVSIIWKVHRNERSARQKRNLSRLDKNEEVSNAGQFETMESMRIASNSNARVVASSLHEHREHEQHMELISEESRNRETKVIAVQVAAYFISILIVSTNILLTISFSPRPRWAAYYHLITRPSHGLVNFIIFVGHKAYDRRKVERTLSWKDAVWKAIFTRHESVFLFDNVKEMLWTLSSTRSDQNDDEEEKGETPDEDDVDPIRRPTLNIMPHLKDTFDEINMNQMTCLPPRADVNESLDSNELLSKNTGSSYGKYMFRNGSGLSTQDGRLSVNDFDFGE